MRARAASEGGARKGREEIDAKRLLRVGGRVLRQRSGITISGMSTLTTMPGCRGGGT